MSKEDKFGWVELLYEIDAGIGALQIYSTVDNNIHVLRITTTPHKSPNIEDVTSFNFRIPAIILRFIKEFLAKEIVPDETFPITIKNKNTNFDLDKIIMKRTSNGDGLIIDIYADDQILKSVTFKNFHQVWDNTNEVTEPQLDEPTLVAAIQSASSLLAQHISENIATKVVDKEFPTIHTETYSIFVDFACSMRIVEFVLWEVTQTTSDKLPDFVQDTVYVEELDAAIENVLSSKPNDDSVWAEVMLVAIGTGSMCPVWSVTMHRDNIDKLTDATGVIARAFNVKCR